MSQPRFANALSVRNALERARMRHAIRLFDAGSRGRTLTKGDLVPIEAEDIVKSRVSARSRGRQALEPEQVATTGKER